MRTKGNLQVANNDDKVASINSGDLVWLQRLIKAINLFRDQHADITANQMVVFLEIVKKPGISQRELMDLTGLPDGTVSRIIAVLSERGNRGVPGHKFIELRDKPDDYRGKAQFPAHKGRRMVEALRGLFT